MYEDHLKSCEYCQNSERVTRLGTKGASSSSFESKPTLYVKSKFTYTKQKKLGELGAIIKGTSYPSMEPMLQTKGASVSNIEKRSIGPIEREIKLKELGKIVRGCYVQNAIWSTALKQNKRIKK